jgi:hypothetical protein
MVNKTVNVLRLQEQFCRRQATDGIAHVVDAATSGVG